jgi:C4-dicarboxylate transporter, DctM subunit
MLAIFLICLVVLVALAVPVASIILLSGIFLADITGRGRFIDAIGDVYWENSTGFILISVPLFIFLGEIMVRSGIAGRMYNSVANWLTWLPGGLMHANIAASTLFAATSGSSVATVATIGTVAYPEIKKRRYHEGIFLGSLAAGGTLGILIPPSIAMIIYGVMTQTSIPDLYLAGIVPGLILAMFLSGMVFVICKIKPKWGGEKTVVSWAERLRSLPDLLAPIAVFGSVVGSIYAGIATPTEAASLGVTVALILSACYRTLSVKMLLISFEQTMVTTAMVLGIVFASMFLNFVLGFTGISNAVLAYVSALDLSAVSLVMYLIVLYILLGTFMEELSMILLTLPVVFPIVMDLNVPGFSDVWFGIIIVLVMELGLISPPFGMNLFVAQALRTRGGPFSDVTRGAIPFAVPMLILILLIVAFPGIATFLPNWVKG